MPKDRCPKTRLTLWNCFVRVGVFSGPTQKGAFPGVGGKRLFLAKIKCGGCYLVGVE
jgi:hypothetical protein